MTQAHKQLNYNQLLEDSLPLLTEWMAKQTKDNQKDSKDKKYSEEPKDLTDSEDFKELQSLLTHLQTSKDFTLNNFHSLKTLLQSFEDSLPLKIKRIFNISKLDNYTVFIASRHFGSIEDFIHLEMSTSKFYGNMTKFFYNPIPLTKVTREFFSYLRTLFVYDKDDDLFEDDERIIQREIQPIPYYLKPNERTLLEKWTGLVCGEIVFDSDKDNWSMEKSDFESKIKGKKQLVFLVQDNEDKKFGFYLNPEIKNEKVPVKNELTEIQFQMNEDENTIFHVFVKDDFNQMVTKTDERSFEFNFDSKRHKEQMTKFPTSKKQENYRLFDQINNILFSYGNSVICKLDQRNLLKKTKPLQPRTDSKEMNDFIDMIQSESGRIKTRNGSKKREIEWMTPKHVMVIQMKQTEEQIQFEQTKEQMQIQQLEDWTGLQFGETIFDSDKDNWKEKESVFGDRIRGRKQLLFVIEDESGEKFGHYLNTSITNNHSSDAYSPTDSKTFQFNLESNGRLNRMMKFPITETSSGHHLFAKNEQQLIVLGNLMLYKQNRKGRSHCIKIFDHFDYYGIPNALCGKSLYDEKGQLKGKTFIPKRIQVIQMKEFENEERKKLFIQRQQEKEKKQIKQLEEWTGLKWKEVVFDSLNDNWSKDYSIFDVLIKGRKQLVFLIEDDRGEKFGYFLNTQVQNKFNEDLLTATDFKSFEFNVESNGRLKEMMKFPVKHIMQGYALHHKSSIRLMDLGNIVLLKEGYNQRNVCVHNEVFYDYKGIDNAVCGRSVRFVNGNWKGDCFVPKRIRVIQMK